MRELRERQATILEDLDRLDRDDESGSAGAVLVTFTEATYPTTAGAVYACHPVDIDCDESEGATPTLTADTSVAIYAANIGTAIPDSGTYLIGVLAGGRWVVQHDG